MGLGRRSRAQRESHAPRRSPGNPLFSFPLVRCSYSAAPRGLSIRSPRRRALQPFLLRVCASPAHFPAAELFGNCFCSFPGMVVALHQGIFVLAICSLSPGRGRIVCCRDGRGGVPTAGLGRQRKGCGEGIQLLQAYRVTLPSHQLKEIERAAAQRLFL